MSCLGKDEPTHHLRPWRFLRKRSHPWAVWCDGHEHCKLTSLVRGIVWGIVWGPETSSMCCLLNSSFSYIYIYIYIEALGKVVNFEVKIPSLFWWIRFSSWNLLFYRSAMYSPWFWPKRTRQEPLFSEPTVEKNCPALLRCEVKNKQKCKIQHVSSSTELCQVFATSRFAKEVRRYTHGILWFRLQLFPWFNSFIFFPMCRICIPRTGLDCSVLHSFGGVSFRDAGDASFPVSQRLGYGPRGELRMVSDVGIGYHWWCDFKGTTWQLQQKWGWKRWNLDEISESYYIDSYWF